MLSRNSNNMTGNQNIESIEKHVHMLQSDPSSIFNSLINSQAGRCMFWEMIKHLMLWWNEVWFLSVPSLCNLRSFRNKYGDTDESSAAKTVVFSVSFSNSICHPNLRNSCFWETGFDLHSFIRTKRRLPRISNCYVILFLHLLLLMIIRVPTIRCSFDGLAPINHSQEIWRWWKQGWHEQ